MHQGISRFRRGAIAAVATLATTAGLLPLAAGGAGAAANFDLTRLAGADRYGTAQAISAASFPTATDVVLATGENFPDALAGNYKAGTAAAPILLTQKSSVPAATQTEINRLNPQRVWVMGGTDAIGAGGVPTTSGTVTRIAGATRYETAVQANSTGTVGSVGGKPTAILATGDKFADALSAGPGAYAGNFPLYLTPGAPATALHSATKAALTARGITNVILMGGTAAISAAVATELQGMGITVTRVEGADRTETARNFAEWLLTNLAFSNALMDVARGDLFPDALAGGPHAGKAKSPILLTWTPTEASPGNSATLGALKYASDHKATLTGGHIFGGTAAVSDAAEAAIEAAGGKIGTGGSAALTARPELVSATIVETVTPLTATPTKPAGTYVRYTFDEAVGTSAANVPANFRVWYFNSSTPFAGAAATTEAGGTSVLVRFDALNSAALASPLSLATVLEGAVFDANALPNAIGDAAIGTAGTSTLTAGATTAPDLLSVSGFRQGVSTGTTAVDFLFDEAAFVTTTGTTGFHLVLTDTILTFEDVACSASTSTVTPSGTNVPGGSGTTTITALCTNPGGTPGVTAGTPLSATNVARGVADSMSVADVGGDANPLQTADVAASGNTADLDLVSVTFTQGTGGGNDSALFDFDGNVTTTGAASLFMVYQSDSTEVGGSTVTVSGVDPSLVLVTFGPTTLDSAVGASVEDGAVTGAAGANQEDEVGVTNSTATTLTPGSTNGPDLQSVKLIATDGFNPTRAVYTFDEDVTDAAVAITAGDWVLYQADGTQLPATTCEVAGIGATPTEDTDNTVVCIFAGNSTTAVMAAVAGAVIGGEVTEEGGSLTNPDGAAPAAA